MLSSHRKTVLYGGTQVPQPFGIAVFENHAFFTDWTKMGVVRTNRFKGSDATLLYRTTKRPGHIVVSHPVLQPIGKEGDFQHNTNCIGLFLFSYINRFFCETLLG